jgi:DNA-binding CsgD family transcriptional regulator
MSSKYETRECSLDDLSPRERQTLVHASTGLTDKEIAVRLGVSLTTVRTYWDRIFQKTHAVNRASAVAFLVMGQAAEVPQVPDRPTEPDTLLEAAVDAAIGGIVVLDDRQNIVAANEKAHALLNCVPGTLEGHPVEKFIDPRFNGFYKVLEAAQQSDTVNVYTVSSFVKVLGGHDLLASITLRPMATPLGRHVVLFLQDYLAEIDARRRATTFRPIS